MPCKIKDTAIEAEEEVYEDNKGLTILKSNLVIYLQFIQNYL